MRYSIIKKSLSCTSCKRVVTFSNSVKPYGSEIRRTTVICILSAAFSSGTKSPINIMPAADAIRNDNTLGNDFSRSLWDGSDKIAFDSLNHPGYSTESDPENFTGGWHVHRKVWEEHDDDKDSKSGDWTKDIIGDITKFDYQNMDIGRPPRILVLYGSLRPNSFSRKCGMFRRCLPATVISRIGTKLCSHPSPQRPYSYLPQFPFRSETEII